jgi:hypothetical protein
MLIRICLKLLMASTAPSKFMLVSRYEKATFTV